MRRRSKPAYAPPRELLEFTRPDGDDSVVLAAFREWQAARFRWHSENGPAAAELHAIRARRRAEKGLPESASEVVKHDPDGRGWPYGHFPGLKAQENTVLESLGLSVPTPAPLGRISRGLVEPKDKSVRVMPNGEVVVIYDS